MKAAIVQASTLAKYNRMDAGFYLGLVDGEEQAADIERARKNLDAAITRLHNVIVRATEVAARTQRMIKDGEVVPIA